jgi:uncharacterized protein YcaQ
VNVLELSADQARRMALAAQGFTDRRPTGRVDRRHLRKVFDRIGVIQIDSVNVLVRSQELPLFARLGPHPRTMLADALDDGELFEYWAHMAAITPSAQHRLFRWRMAKAHLWDSVNRLEHRRPGFLEEVLAQVRDLGPITASDLGERAGKKGSWWDWDDGKIALEHLFSDGRVAARRRRNDFARLYDLPERVLPDAALAAPTPSEPEARKELLVIAARAMGVATHGDLADYHRQNAKQCQPFVRELVEAGELLPAKVEGWAKPAFVHPEATVPRWVKGRALLSPFDSLVWSRERTERVFGFHYRIEIYTPPPKRVYGYYVLPFLLDGELVGRIDLKADRAAGVLRVQAAHAEPGVDAAPVAVNLAAELRSMADWLELDRVAASDRGDLAPALRKAGVARIDAP